MIISHKHRFVFVEIPHTASHSIAEQLIAHYGGKPILRKHANVTQFLDHATTEEKSYFKFATVRNPLDTVTTDYAKLKGNHKGQFTNPEMLIRNGGHVTADHLREFEYIQSNSADFAAFFTTFRSRLYNNWFLIGHQHINHIIRFENLQEGFSEVLSRLRIQQVEAIPHVNKTKGKSCSYEDYYTPELYQRVAACYGPFMVKWAYDFPSGWGEVSISRLSQLQFSIVDQCASIGASFLTIDPDNPVFSRAKKAIDFLTRRK